MTSGPVPPDRVQDLVRPYLVASTPGEVLGALLDRVAACAPIERMVAVGAAEGLSWSASAGVSAGEAAAFARAFAKARHADGAAEAIYGTATAYTTEEAAGATADAAAEVGEFADRATARSYLSIASPTLVSLSGGEGVDLAVVFDEDPDAAEGSRADPDAVRESLRLALPFLIQSVRVEHLQSRVRLLELRQRRYRTALHALPDPVLVIDSEWRIPLANQRAEDLFIARADDSPGRRHALETNNLLFSAFRARAAIERREGHFGEIVLVDPTEGSDLLFEVSVLPFREFEGSEDGSVFLLRDITDLKQATHELEIQFARSVAAEHAARRESQRLNVMIENAGAPILVTDPQANIVLMNREAERLLAATPSGTGAHDASRNDAKIAGYINEFMLQPARRREGRLSLVDPEEGRELPSLVVSTKILDGHREATAVVTVLHDLTQEVENQRLALELRILNAQLEERVASATRELAQRNAQLEAQSSELARTSRMKTEFLAMMSHELRTPINAVLGYNALLRDGLFGQLTPEQRDALVRMRNAAEHLLTLISDILDLARVEAGQIPLTPTDIDLTEYLEGLAESVRPMAEEKSLAYSLEVDVAVPRIRTDATRLRQVLLNLLSNAVKFTESGSITLRAGPSASVDHVRFEVVDTGMGIAASDLESIFDEFTQADQSPTRQHGGAGLGLTISRRLAEAMGGELGVESELGRGSTFYVEVPVAPPAGSDSVLAESSVGQARSGRAEHVESGTG